METRQGKIEKKSLAFARNKAPYATFTIDGRNYNTFDKDIADNFQPEDFVEFTGETNVNGFWELKTMKKIDVVEPQHAEHFAKGMVKYEGKTNGTKEYHLSPEEVKCRALESAIKITLKEQATPEQMLPLADKFVKWIYGNN